MTPNAQCASLLETELQYTKALRTHPSQRQWHSCCLSADLFVSVFHSKPCMQLPWKTPHRMMTSSNGNIFRGTGPLCGEFAGPGELPTQRPVTRSFDVFFDLRLNKRLSKQPWGGWFETLSWSLWRHGNGKQRHQVRCDTVQVLSGTR